VPAADRPFAVLIVDDVEDTREMYAEYLRFKGYDVDTASNGREGLARALATTPAAIVLDLTMPGIDGFEVMRMLRLRSNESTANTFVIVVSGHALKGMESRVKDAGADVFLTKPCLPEELETTLAARRSRRRRG
jgi:CheY-like chemotaxis protein